ncbi:uncharacterized protein A4U43_C03F23230 [Asparagus officinalis]|uniref:DUF4378 domain-containing protein n=1 Tax=Asparagus officinalis TaxID=4686 RepID=A0A5P1FHH4_ASPOF|nr:uncharacterized protein LOC109834277 [Asparagus officinalis]ONK76040.1 uncharacterized protein A4U43_C03F23230 [Asparagus officinalis]
MASGRQLFELLEEKQEPFLLNVYLMENGCSSKRLERISSQGFTNKGRRGAAGSFLRSILTKLLQGKQSIKALNCDSKSIESGRMSVFSCFSGISPRELGGDHQCRCVEMEDSSKQLSPVSVLQYPNHRFKEENQSTSSSFDSPREMPEISAFPHHTKSNKGQVHEQQLILDCVREAEERIRDYGLGCFSTEVRAKAIREKVLSWEKLQGDMSSLGKLLGSDISELRSEWSQYRADAAEIGIGVEAFIFEEILDETVLEILGSRCT